MFYSASFGSNLKNEICKHIYKLQGIWKYNHFLVSIFSSCRKIENRLSKVQNKNSEVTKSYFKNT